MVDYKTNWLGRPPTPEEQAAGTRPPLAAHDYRPDALVEAMGHSDYPLQALLYAMVLHRFLRWRQPGYDPDTHLGGVLYLYLRGMCGPDTPRYDGHPTGVFSWRPPSALVVALSDLMDGAGAMTELWEPLDERDARLALGASGLLADFNRAGVLTAAAVHVARRAAALAGDVDDRVLLAAALAVRSVTHGSVGADLARVGEIDPDLPWPSHDDWVAAVQGSALLAQGVLRHEHGLVYLDRYHRLEAPCAPTCSPAPLTRPRPSTKAASRRC